MVSSMMDLTTLEGKDTPGRSPILPPKRSVRRSRNTGCRLAPRFAFIPIWSVMHGVFWAMIRPSMWHLSPLVPERPIPLRTRLEETRRAVADGAG